MSEKTHEAEMEDLKEHVSKLGAELSGIVGDIKKLAGLEGEHSVFKNLQHKFEEVKTQGEKGFKKVTEEVEEHPYISILTVLGVGLIIAGLLYRNNKK
ncbi:MAG: hypothetical protein A2539_02310 [Elusimicrobia bacterium RIFOXYD2_FULL_34_15]|nr:MAG: hypothetical protein A2539_02310 [Elusimicrobia bacterium RIFOXYD2_FULL_34_15]